MDKRQLGQSGIEISPLGLGSVKFGRNQGVKYPSSFELPDDAALANLLAIARDMGINMLDTAPAYGSSEERLGTLLQGQRDDWVIVGKVGEEFEGGVSSHDFTPDHLEMSVMRSLKRLNTDYIDIMLLHSDGNDLEIMSDDVIAKMHEFKTRGIVRAIGASTKTPAGGIRALETMDIAMCTYNPACTEETPVLDYAHQNNKGTLLKKALSSGHDTNIEDALRFAFDHEGTGGIIIGTINPDHLRQNIEMATKVLSSAKAA